MKIVKYLVAALLIVSVTKKVHVQDSSSKVTSTSMPIFSLDLADSDMSQVSGIYNPTSKTAQITFTNVLEHNRATTPPNVDNPDLIKFGSMPTSQLFQNASKPGGLSATTSLWGIAKTSQNQKSAASTISKKQNQPEAQILNYDKTGRIIYMDDGKTYVAIEENIPFDAITPKALQAIPSSKKLYGIPVTGETIRVKPAANLVSGYYWPSNKIVQLQNGQTFVEILAEQKGNYKKIGAHALGPVWTRFDEKALLNTYGISTKQEDFKSLVTTIGTIKQNKKTFTLYGVLFKPATNSTDKPASKSSSFKVESSKKPAITKETVIPNLDQHMSHIRQTVLHQALTSGNPEAMPQSHTGYTPGFHG